MTELIGSVDAALRRAVETNEVPGVVAMAATDNGIIYAGAFGRRDLALDPDMTLDTMFRLASITKPVTSVAAMQLVSKASGTWDSQSVTSSSTHPTRSPFREPSTPVKARKQGESSSSR